MIKNFFAIICAAILSFANPAQVADNIFANAFNSVELTGDSAENFYAALPKANGNYKSSLRPILIEGAMNIETEILFCSLRKVTFATF